MEDAAIGKATFQPPGGIAGLGAAKGTFVSQRQTQFAPHAEVGHDLGGNRRILGKIGFHLDATSDIELAIDIGVKIGIEDRINCFHCRSLR